MIPNVLELDLWLDRSETAVGGVRAGCAKRVVWANGVQKTPISLVYVHGFSATGAEVRPLPDLVAKALGANVYFARLTGHGQDGQAMGQARLSDWQADVVEALEIGALLGDQVIVMGCSTGCTLLTAALANSAGANSAGANSAGANGAGVDGQIIGIVHLSPNFGLRRVLAQALLQMPMVRRWGPLIVGRTCRFEAISAEHAAFWTLDYDTQAVFTMADAVRAALASPIGQIKTPAYFAFAQSDQVVSPRRTQRVMARWAGPVTHDSLVQGPNDDKMGHVMAGDVFSPKQTAPLADRIIAWAQQL